MRTGEQRLPIRANPIAVKYGEKVFLVFVVFVSGIFMLKNLGNCYLWQDEAQTALVSKTILTQGAPYGTDGKNFFSQEHGSEYGKNYIWKWHTWLPFYILAGCYKVFGVSTFVSRFPFALFGVGTILISYFFVRWYWKSRWLAVMTVFLFLSSIPFILLSRQCRYYSMMMFFSVWSLYAYARFCEVPSLKWRGVHFVIAASCLFHTHYLYFGAALATVFLHTMIFHRRIWKQMISVMGITIAVNLPWIIWLATMGYGKAYGDEVFNTSKWLFSMAKYVVLLNGYVFPWPYFLILFVVILYHTFKKESLACFTVGFWRMLCLPLFFLITTYAALVITNPYPFFRYLSAVIPVVLILLAMVIRSSGRIHKVIPVILIGVVFYFSQMPKFFYEITHDYDGPIEGIANYLNQHAKPGDTLLITYGDMPLKFYTPLRIYGGLTGEDLSGVTKPDWFIMRQQKVFPDTLPTYDYIERNVSKNEYEKITIDYRDTLFENREEPHSHQFQTVQDSRIPRVVIYRRKK